MFSTRFLFFLLAGALAAAPNLRIHGGLADHQVLQRNAQGQAAFELSGEAEEAEGATVELRVLGDLLAVNGFDWRPSARVQGGKWRAQVSALPIGGPYRVQLRLAGRQDVVTVRDILVGDLWVLAGQSNMQGVGDLVDVTPPHALVHSFDMTDEWGAAREPLHTLVNAADRVHWPLNASREPQMFPEDRLRKFLAERKKGSGLGLPFAAEMIRRTGVPIGLVPCAHGGTSMDQWDPALRDKGGDSLYGSMIRRVRAVGGKVTGALWYQGESDANPKAAPLFQAKFERFVASVREYIGDPGLPFYYVQIGRHVNRANEAEWNLVQESQRRVEATISRSGLIASVDAVLDDGIHVSTGDLKRLGVRFANLACHDLFAAVAECARLKRGPRPASAVFRDGVLRVSFSEVNGSLYSTGRLSGFSVHGTDGAPLAVIYKARVDAADPSAVLLSIQGKLPPGATLHYGYGKDPYCNLRDRADMAAPVFGPMEIQVP